MGLDVGCRIQVGPDEMAVSISYSYNIQQAIQTA